MSEEATVRREPGDYEISADPREQHEEDISTATREANSTQASPPTRESTPQNHPRTNREQQSIMPLFSGNESQALRSRWDNVQVSFVDEPKHSVEEADRLVSEAINSLSRSFAAEREKLEQQWHRGEDVSTEDLRVALRRYRSFFERLLAL